MEYINNLKISLKLPLFSMIFLIIACGSVGMTAYSDAKRVFTEETHMMLSAIVTARKAELNIYMESIQRNIITLAGNPHTVEALQAFKKGWSDLKAQKIDPETFLQDTYMNKNPYSLEERGLYYDAKNQTTYNQAHVKYHSIFHLLKIRHDYYDIFLFNPEGDLLYTVAKEADYATNFKNGLWKNTNLARGLKETLEDFYQIQDDNKAIHKSHFHDYTRYGPSNNKLQSFITSSIYDETGKIIGVIGLQIPLTRINEIMQKYEGLGETGETYLVGSDFTLRTNSRFSKKDPIDILLTDTPHITKALNGETASKSLKNYRDVPSYTHYSALSFLGVDWAIIAEISDTEMNAPIKRMGNIMFTVSFLILNILAFMAFILTRSLAHPLSQMTNVMKILSSGNNAISIPHKDRKDEIGAIARAVEIFKTAAIERELLKLKAQTAQIALKEEEQKRQEEKDAQQTSLIVEKENKARLVAKLEGKKELAHRVLQLERSELLLEKQASDLKILSQDLKIERDKAHETADTKSNFLASMSHEIRTPMNGILGMIGLLLDTKLSHEQKSLADDVQYSADNLLVIINEILDFSKLESGSTRLEIINFDINHTITSAMKLLHPVARKANVDLSYTLANNGQEWLQADQARIRQIIINLVGNAIKFSYDGEVNLSCECTPLEDNQIELLITIKDTGIGISSEQIQYLFERFSQADNSISRKYGGTGLGLTICKELINLMEGEIDVESEIGLGSTFWFKITCPAGLAQTAQKKEALKFIQSENASQYTILVAEDNFINQRLIGNLLLKFKHKFDFANDGHEALKMTQKTRYDLILMDIQMPHMDGITATKEIRKLESAAGKIPIIALTANVMENMEAEYYEAGMNDFISKPIDRDLFHAAIQRVMAEKGSS
jgi:signal transduction histidine kinase/ActR/RegA family two-component response regulator